MTTEVATRRRSLLVLASTYPRWSGDVEPAFVHELSRRLLDEFEVSVICPHAAGAAPRELLDGVSVLRYRYAPQALETLVNGGGIMTNLRVARWKWLLVPGFFLAQWWALWRFCRSHSPEVIHAHWLIPQGIIASLMGGRIPLVVTSHGADLFAIRGRLFNWLRRRVLRRASAVTVVSRAMQQRLDDELPASIVHVMPMGVDFSQRFAATPAEQPAVNTILFVGRLVEKKGVIHLLDALPRVLARYPDAHLDIVGFGPELQRLQERAHALGLERNVRFLGARPQAELPALYRRAAVFVAPFTQAANGDQEGLGLVVVEALACGCPVIVGDVPAVHDVLEEARETIVPQADVPALASAIIAVLDDPLAARVKALHLREGLERKLSWPAVSAAYAALLGAAAESPRKR